MNRLFLLAGCIVLWSSAVVAQDPDLIFEQGFENSPDAVEILSFTANPASVFAGQSTTISWTLKDAASCVATDGTAEWQALIFEIPNGESVVPDGSFEVNTLTTEGNYPFTLTCTGAVGDPPTDTKTIDVTVQSLTCADPSLDTGINKTWSGFWGEAFPDSVGTNVAQFLNTGYYLSIQFNTGSVVNNGRFVSNDYVLAETGTRLGTISKCIGRFEAPAACTHTWQFGQPGESGLNWATDGTVGACVLEPNTTYFMNMTFTDGVNSNTDTCTTGECSLLLRHDLDPVNP